MSRILILLLPLLAATIASAAPSGACVNGETVLKNESMEISFASAAEGYGVSSIVNLLGGGRTALPVAVERPAAGRQPLRQSHLRGDRRQYRECQKPYHHSSSTSPRMYAHASLKLPERKPL